MISDRIKQLRETAGYSQSQLAKKLDVTRSSVNAWEMGVSTPTSQYVVAMAELFHVQSDFLLGINDELTLSLGGYSARRLSLFSAC